MRIRLLRGFMAATLLLMSGCTEGVKPHEPGATDVYCVYTVTASRGGGAIPVGGTICLYCTPPPKNTCKQQRTISPAPGIEYDLTTTVRNCTSCPAGGHTYELK
jgi:hypothetical protein